MSERIPLAVLAFASRLPQLGPLPPRPYAWRELSGEWVVVFEDGRKLRFMKGAASPSVDNSASEKKGRKK